MSNSKLQAEFTNWIDTLAYRTKINYIRKEKRHQGMMPIDEVPEENLGSEELQVSIEFVAKGEFDFQSEWLEKAFAKLSDTCKEVLRMLYVEEKSTQEIAAYFNCTVRNINWHKDKALKIIREQGEKK